MPETKTIEKDEFKIFLLKQLYDLVDNNGFNSLERPKQLMFLKEPFSVENGILTPTMKFKRSVAK